MTDILDPKTQVGTHRHTTEEQADGKHRTTPGDEDIAAKLARLANDVRKEMQRNLRDDAVTGIMRPLDEMIQATKELGELQNVHAALNQQIIQPVIQAQQQAAAAHQQVAKEQRTSTRWTFAFGIIGVVALVVSLIIAAIQQSSQERFKTELKEKFDETVSKVDSQKEAVTKLADASTQKLEEIGKLVAARLSSSSPSSSSVPTQQGRTGTTDPVADGYQGIISGFMKDPREAYRDAFIKGDERGLVAAAGRAVDRKIGVFEEVTMVGTLLALGMEAAVPLAERIWANYKSTITPEYANTLLGAWVRYSVSKNEDTAKLFEKQATEISQYVQNHADSTDVQKAYAINQLGILAYSYDSKRSEELTRKAIGLNPQEAAYYYNLSLIYEKDGDLEKAIEFAEEAIKRQKEPRDADHYRQAIDVYVARLKQLQEQKAEATEITKVQQRLVALAGELRSIDEDKWLIAVLDHEELRKLVPPN